MNDIEGNAPPLKKAKSINPLEALIKEGEVLISRDPNIKVYDQSRDNS